MNKLTVIGGGLAGCEAAYAAANRGIEVELIEMKPAKKTAAHKSDSLAELVCSNSLKAARVDSAAGLLKEEMRRLGSVCLAAADKSAVAASGIIAGINAAAEITGEKPLVLPETTMTGALLSYITNPLTENFQPMGANFGIIPPLETHIRDKRERYAALAARALGILADNIKTEEM